MNQVVAKRIAARMARMDGAPIPADQLSVMRQQVICEEFDRYEAEHAVPDYGSGLPEQWSDLIPDFDPEWHDVKALARGSRLG